MVREGVRRAHYLMVRIWYVYQDELREIVLSDGRKDAVFKNTVVVDKDTHIYALSDRVRRGSNENQPLRTSLISPGGDCRTKALAT